jgi:hypothetical protein
VGGSVLQHLLERWAFAILTAELVHVFPLQFPALHLADVFTQL